MPSDPGDSTDGRLLAAFMTTDELLEATSDRAWLDAMLWVEAALARAESAAGIVPATAADAIATACSVDRFDAAELGRAARLGGNPVIPLVDQIAAAVPPDAAPWVHFGATSQDIIDTAAMLVTMTSLDIVSRDLAGLADACADLAERHRDTLMVGRTLLQHAVPTTFGLKAAGWLVAVDATRDRLADVVARRLAVQLGGAAGTLASLGEAGPDVVRLLAAELGLAEPVLPWHTDRTRIAEIAGALALVAGVAAKIALDVILLAQTEVAEVREGFSEGAGGSSTMPHKRNPAGAVSVTAAARRAQGLVSVLLGGMAQEHERAAGAWHAEWQTLTDLLRSAGGAAAGIHAVVANVEVDADRMAENLAATRGAILAERVAVALGPSEVGRAEARAALRDATRRAASSGRSLEDELLDDDAVAAVLPADRIRELLDPTTYLGAAGAFVDRALAAHRST